MKKPIRFQKALSLLLKGEVVAIPTETVYGLAGRIDKDKTLKKIFALKKRPLFNPLIVHCYNQEQALEYLSGDTSLPKMLFDFFAPGPLTLVAKKNSKISALITAGKSTVALRIPKHPLTRKLLKNLSAPLAAPSANPYGRVSPVSAFHVLSSFKNKVPVLDGGNCQKGLESTIVFPDKKRKKIFILRPGIITKKQLEMFIHKKNLNLTVEYKKDPFQPGGQSTHYKPDVPLYIIETQKEEKEIRKFLSKKFPDRKLKKLHLNSSAHQTAKNLYSQMRRLSKYKETILFIQKTKNQEKGLWKGIWNRLNKASSAQYRI